MDAFFVLIFTADFCTQGKQIYGILKIIFNQKINNVRDRKKKIMGHICMDVTIQRLNINRASKYATLTRAEIRAATENIRDPPIKYLAIHIPHKSLHQTRLT